MVLHKRLKVAELFAGVGGFRLGLDATDHNGFETVWANQWEPGKKVQHAFSVYDERFKTGEKVNRDIGEVTDREMAAVGIDMIVGGFPCQDYSVARSLSGELGLRGKKGVLFWEIARFVSVAKPKYILLENVDRLLKSPSVRRGRDFGVMLAVLNALQYDVEWRVVNAAEHGHPQRRKRVFIFAVRHDADHAIHMLQYSDSEVVAEAGVFAETFPVHPVDEVAFKTTALDADIVIVSDEFKFNFENAGLMRNGVVTTAKVSAVEQPATVLGDILEANVDEKYYLSPEKIDKFKYLRGGKKLERTTKEGFTYTYSEGAMSETDALDKPGRTMLTSEGTVNRSTHLIEDSRGRRLLTPVEAERLNGFPDGWTEGIPERARYFCMGNALVVPVVTAIGNTIEAIELKHQF